MLKFYHVFPSALSSAKCDEIIQRGMACTPQSGSIGDGSEAKSDSHRVSTIRWLDPYSNKGIRDVIFEYAERANREFFGFDISVGSHELQFTEYQGNTNGRYGWHHDVFWTSNRPYDRKLSVVVQLSYVSAYSGGGFEFEEPGLDNADLLRFSERGSILVFPSFIKHRVTPVDNGTRYSLVSWVDGPKFR